MSDNRDSSTSRNRSPASKTIPLTDRYALDLGTAAGLMSISERTAKRIAVDHPELTCRVGRRRLFIRAKLEAWLTAGGSGST